MSLSPSTPSPWWQQKRPLMILLLCSVVFGTVIGLILLERLPYHIKEKRFSEVVEEVRSSLSIQEATKQPRDLSPDLIQKIIDLSHLLQPQPYQDEWMEESRVLSYERGALLAFLLRQQLTENSYQKIFTHANFEKAVLHNPHLPKEPNKQLVNLQHYYLMGANLRGSSWINVHLVEPIILDHAQLQGARFEKVKWYRAQLQNANLYQSEWQESTLYSASFRESNVRQSQFTNTNFESCSFQLANLQQSLANNSSFSSCKMEEVNLQGIHFRHTPVTKSELHYARFQYAQLDSCDLDASVFREADFSNSILQHCQFFYTDLSATNFKNSQLKGCSFGGTDFVQTNLEGVQLAQISSYGMHLLPQLEEGEVQGLDHIRAHFLEEIAFVEQAPFSNYFYNFYFN